MAKLYNDEAKKLLAQYTKVRQEVLVQRRLVHKAGKFVGYQERIIAELRQFIQENLAPTFEILDRMNLQVEGAKRAQQELERTLKEA